MLFTEQELALSQEKEFNAFVASFDTRIVTLLKAYVEKLKEFSGSMTFNPWQDQDSLYDVENSVQWRCNNLLAYLLPRIGRSRYMIVAEAIGYQGGHFTGIAITCERMLLGYHHAISADAIAPIRLWRTSDRQSSCIPKGTQQEKGFNEPTDTVVWSAMVEQGINTYDAILWNIFPFHPHKSKANLSNRTPSEAELAVGWNYMSDLLDLHEACAQLYKEGALYPLEKGAQLSTSLPGTKENPILAVGRKCAGVLETFGLPAIALRHPANGGASEYRRNFEAAVRSNDNK